MINTLLFFPSHFGPQSQHQYLPDGTVYDSRTEPLTLQPQNPEPFNGTEHICITGQTNNFCHIRGSITLGFQYIYSFSPIRDWNKR
jgi:hypothetical protein